MRFVLLASWALMAALTAFSEEPSKDLALKVFNQLKASHDRMLVRMLRLETHIDGLTPEFRAVLNDRKTPDYSEKDTPPQRLNDPTLIQTIVTERKRLESEQIWITDTMSTPSEMKKGLAKAAAILLRLDFSEILVDYIEYLDDFNRGKRSIPSTKRNNRETASEKTQNDIALMKFSAATLFADDYSKERKQKLSYANAELVNLTPQGKPTLEALESGIGSLSEDTLPVLPPGATNVQIKEFEIKRVERTRKILQFLEQLSASTLAANKQFQDEYQYSLIKLKRKIELEKEERAKSKKTNPKK